MSRGERKQSLSPRQRQIGELVAQGLQDKQIAEALGISEETVNHHLKRAFAKCGFHSRVQLGLFVVLRVCDPKG